MAEAQGGAMQEAMQRESGNLFQEAADYMLDAGQRWVLFWDLLRKRGNIYLDHLEKEQPPVLVFSHEIICDGRTYDKPVNYALTRILDKRSGKQSPGYSGGVDRRSGSIAKEKINPELMRPIVIIDPRAGHGPGIGGSKEASEIGHALSNGHPVYFVIFFIEPVPGQTLADVKEAEGRFLEEVMKRHPKAPKPLIIGNCQGGWAAAMVAADRPDLAGPLVLSGSPISYWSGRTGENPMRYRGGLMGGVWFNSFLSDLGGGIFDGANLVMNMEDLNPANTWWTKLYNVFSKVDTEEKRFLNFEKWWGGFFLLTSHEIHTIVNDLFIGNRLARGELELEKGHLTDLKKFNDPVVVFASRGDNITPTQQALNWIPMVYESVEEIQRHGQVIVYVVHENVGHLGIFVGSSIAAREQKEIIGSVEMIHYLSPGLYEMVIEEAPAEGRDDYKVSFKERTIEDVLAFDDGLEDEKAFELVMAVSERNDHFYRQWFSSLVRSMVTPLSAELTRQLHPLRAQRYLVSDYNPFVKPLETAADVVRGGRRPVAEENVFVQSEAALSEMATTLLDGYRDMRDLGHEVFFTSVYENPVMAWLYGVKESAAKKEEKSQKAKSEHQARTRDRDHWHDEVAK
ncbi:MAG: DUF3141 domain-containing protein, partial [Desulfobacterales bacterium]|nr:DUF3141 domain-containing protein [Desulfobacterales bacterium]